MNLESKKLHRDNASIDGSSSSVEMENQKGLHIDIPMETNHGERFSSSYTARGIAQLAPWGFHMENSDTHIDVEKERKNEAENIEPDSWTSRDQDIDNRQITIFVSSSSDREQVPLSFVEALLKAGVSFESLEYITKHQHRTPSKSVA